MLQTALFSLVIAAQPMPVSVDGDGFFRLVDQGRIVYARQIALESKGGWLADAKGALLFPRVSAPVGFSIDPQGWISDSQGHKSRIALALFTAGSEPAPAGPYLVSEARPKLAFPGDGLAGSLSLTGTTKPAPKPAAQAEAKLSVTVRDSSQVQADIYTLGDISSTTDPKLASLELGRCPVPGASATVTKALILSRLRAAGFKPEDIELQMPTRCVVTRQAQTIPQQQFVDCVMAYANAKLGGQFEMRCSDPSFEASAKPGQIELRVERFDSGTDRASATVAIYVDGTRQNSRTMHFTLSGPGGEPLVRVAAGTAVKLRLWSGGACVEVPARMQASCLVGQTARVTTDLRTTHTGILTDPNTVEVKL